MVIIQQVLVINEDVKENMREILADVQTGKFASESIQEFCW